MIELALAAVVGSVIGMAAILWDLECRNKTLRRRLRDADKTRDYLYEKLHEAREKLRPYQRTHGKNGKFNGRGQ